MAGIAESGGMGPLTHVLVIITAHGIQAAGRIMIDEQTKTSACANCILKNTRTRFEPIEH